MICADTSAWISYLAKEEAGAPSKLFGALTAGNLVVSMPVLAELVSSPKIPLGDLERIQSLPRIELSEEAWLRAAENRKALLKRGLKAHLVDSLIAQACIDHGVPLITGDSDFRHFVSLGLMIL